MNEERVSLGQREQRRALVLNQVLAGLATPERRGWVKARVELHERLDGSRVVVYQGREIPSRPAPLDTPARRTSAALAAAPPVVLMPLPVRAPRPPADTHPWRQYRGMTNSQHR